MENISTDFNDLSSEQQTFIVNWLKDNFKETKSYNYHHSAYGLKQNFSRLNFYVTEEQFTTAMCKAGFKTTKSSTGAHHFAISNKSKYFHPNH